MALITPFAENGNRATIPQTTSDGSVSYDQGFGNFYALPPEEGGLFIDRAQFNQLMYDTTSQVLTNKSNIATIQSDVSSINNTISQVVSSDVTPIGVYKNVENKTIGANGDFKTIHEAFVYAQTHQKQGMLQGLTLTLLENLSGDLSVSGAWYPYLTIDCNGFVLADKLDILFSSLIISNLKSNDRVTVAFSVTRFINSVDINYQSNDWPQGCITITGPAIAAVVSNNFNFSTTSGKSAFRCNAGGTLTVGGQAAITQRTGANCFSVSGGGIIQVYPEVNLSGVTVPKANQAANTLTRHGIIFGNYTL